MTQKESPVGTETPERNPRTGHNALTVGLAMMAGLGFALMAVALAIGVVQAETADSNDIGLLFAGGLAIFAAGSVSWGLSVRPWERFDDINVPRYHGHHHDGQHHDEGTGEDHAHAT